MLDSLRVVDLTDSVAGAYGTKLFAAFGADVVKVEPPGGDETRGGPSVGELPDGSILGAYLHTGKRSVVLDGADVENRARLLALLRNADLIVESGASVGRGINLAAVLKERPGMVLCSVTPYGQDGPHAAWRSTALTAAAAGGQMALCGEPGQPPLMTAGDQAGYQGGLHVFAASITALLGAARTGAGDHIDLSLQEIQAAGLEGAGPNAMVHGLDAERTGNQMRATWGIYPCADGHVGVNAMRRQTAAVYECIGHPELAEDPSFLNILVNPEYNDVVEAFILEWTATRTQAEIYTESQRYRAPFALIADPATLLASEHLRVTEFWSYVDHPELGRHAVPGTPVVVDGARAAQRRAPLLGEHTAEVLGERFEATGRAQTPPAAPPPLPLDGLRVLDFTQVWAGPYGTRFLADMGADVIHIEGPRFPDAVRGVGRADDTLGYNKSAYFNEYNRNKRGLALDLQSAAGLATIRRMVARADVVIENWSVGVAERLGIGYEDLRAINPRIVFVQMPAFGNGGPEAERVGFGPTIEQMGGLVALQGYEGAEPHKSGISYGDPTGGTVAAGATALALWRRERNGQGAHVVVAQRDNIIGLIGEYIVAQSVGRPLPARHGNRHPVQVPHGVYQGRADAGRHGGFMPGSEQEFHETWLALAVEDDAQWAALQLVVDDPRLDDPTFGTAAGRKTGEAGIDAVIGEWALGLDPIEAAESLQAAGVPASAVLTPLMLTRDAHLQARGFYPEVKHPDAGRHRTTRPVWRLERRPFEGARPAPCFGQDNQEVLREVAGLTASEIEALEEVGVVSGTPLSE